MRRKALSMEPKHVMEAVLSSSRPLVLCLFLVAVVALPAGAYAETRLTASDGVVGDRFGSSVATSGNTIVVGASGDDANGSAYVFKFNGTDWVEETKLTASDGGRAEGGDSFGASVAITGNTVVVGAPFHGHIDNDHGAAYVFKFNGLNWVEEAELLAGDRSIEDWLGISVTDTETFAVAGAPNNVSPVDQKGAVYVFRHNGTEWVQTKLTASDAALYDGFGISVAIAGNTVVVGAPGHVHGDYQGAAYIFKYDGTGWVEEVELHAGDGVLGWPVAISGSTIVVGGTGNDGKRSVYVFKYNGTDWMEEGRLTASDGVAGDNFGSSVAASGNTIVVGANLYDTKGSAYVFKYNGTDWVEEFNLAASDGASSDDFGASVGITGSTIVVGASGSGSYKGAAYVYRLESTIDDILAFFDASIADGDLVGVGLKPGTTNRAVKVFRKALEQAEYYIDNRQKSRACAVLGEAYRRVDGNPKPSDIIAGAEASQLATMIQNVRLTLGCPL
ncbi:MAG: hypothetical protein A4E65_01103 [Syntrophorhabdus sp. PtaU1.Bin153]|nr:MAG: hypothetical protein A4E65_01103 [Syntrophorhabdus sp. PtaU1.Bin153]